MKEGTDGADLLQQLTGQKSGRQEPGDPEGAPVKDQVASVIAPSSTSETPPPPLSPHSCSQPICCRHDYSIFFLRTQKYNLLPANPCLCKQYSSFGHCHIAAVYAIRICD